jgi:hypothetical protein
VGGRVGTLTFLPCVLLLLSAGPANTYGAADKVYGWAAAPCKPCPRNMITDGATKVNNSDVCVNDDGFGYASEGESHYSATLTAHSLTSRVLIGFAVPCVGMLLCYQP